MFILLNLCRGMKCLSTSRCRRLRKTGCVHQMRAAPCNQCDGDRLQRHSKHWNLFFAIPFNPLLSGPFCINVNYFIESFRLQTDRLVLVNAKNGKYFCRKWFDVENNCEPFNLRSLRMDLSTTRPNIECWAVEAQYT